MAWELTGNAGTNPTTDFLGTTDNQPLVIRTNDTEQLRIVDGRAGFGTDTPRARLDVGADDIVWGNSRLSSDQGGSIELGGHQTLAGKGTSYIDFHFQDLAQDFNTRIINDADGQLTIAARVLRVRGTVQSTFGGFRFPDGSLQTSASLRGPQGPPGQQGPPGPSGPAVRTFAVCVASGACGCTGGSVVSIAFGACSVTSDTGGCQNGNLQSGSCCVCAP
jgi:hypothetical protein